MECIIMDNKYEDQLKKYEQLSKKQQTLLQEAMELNAKIDLAKEQYSKMSKQAIETYGTDDPDEILKMAQAKEQENEKLIQEAEENINQLENSIRETKESIKRIVESLNS